ncbi:MAG TPA: 1,2-phenylacetyl-CoA epoxidase subunit PaaC [Gemmatimonadaceae bacterium]|nr:1,2-phenylacetyl-CoA epoxidase subunit PaaC [Gemmatimonadaceae bacterium]
MTSSLDHTTRAAYVEYLLRLGDDRLVLGHRLSQWCGHAPILEEDIALANVALDLIGQATLLLGRAGAVEGAGRDADALAYFREAVDYRNALITELPKGDFALTMLRQLLFSTYALQQWTALQQSADADLAGIAAKAIKETRYHVRTSASWTIMLGDGTDESHRRAQRALDDLWRYTGELFLSDDVDRVVSAAGLGAPASAFESVWRAQVEDVLARATLRVPDAAWMQRGGRQGRHTEHLGHMLAEMQIVARSFPGASW